MTLGQASCASLLPEPAAEQRSVWVMMFAVSGCFPGGAGGLSWAVKSHTARYRVAAARPAQATIGTKPGIRSSQKESGYEYHRLDRSRAGRGPARQYADPRQEITGPGHHLRDRHLRGAPGRLAGHEAVPRGHPARVLQPLHLA